MNILIRAGLLYFLASNVAFACNSTQVDNAYRAGNYVLSEQLASGDSRWCLQGKADAAFAQGKYADAHKLYARSIAKTLDADFDATKGTSKFWSGVGQTVGFLAMAASLYAASEGAMTADQATNSMLQGQEIVMNSSGFEEATGHMDFRKAVKETIKDLRQIARRGSTSFQAINSGWSRMPGAGLTRVHASGRVCNAVRLAVGRYLTSPTCLAGAGNPSEQYMSVGSGLRVSDIAKVARTSEDGPFIELEVRASGNEDDLLGTSDWFPRIYSGQPPVRFSAVWFAKELNYLVPVYRECGHMFSDCDDAMSSSATLWASPCDSPSCPWFFYGFAGSSGTIEAMDMN